MSEKTGQRGQKEADRAAIIRLLVPVYPEGLTVGGLQQALMIERRPMDDAELSFHLAYLEEGGYVKLEAQPPRRGKKKKILLASATKKGVDLLDQRIPEDAGIAL